MLRLDRDINRIAADCPQSVVSFLVVRIAAVRKSVDDGAISVSSAIDHLRNYSAELQEVHDEWEPVDSELEYLIEDKSMHGGFKKKNRTPLSVRTERGDFDSPNYTVTARQVWDDSGLQEHYCGLDELRR